MSFSKNQIDYLKGEIRNAQGCRVAEAIPSTCPPHIVQRIIERRAKRLGIKPEVDEKAVDLATRLSVLQSVSL